MNIYDLLARQRGGHIQWVEQAGDGEGPQLCRMNLGQMNSIHIEYQRDGEWIEWEDLPPGAHREDVSFLNALVDAAAAAGGYDARMAGISLPIAAPGVEG